MPRPAASRIVLFLVFAFLLCAFGCSDSATWCTLFKTKKVIVKMQGEARIALESPVTLGGVPIGQVKDKGLDKNQRPYLKLCVDKGRVEALDTLTVFYIDRDSAGEVLVCEILAQGGEEPDERVFLGFSSYNDYLTWKARYFTTKGSEGLRQALEDALQ